MRYFTGYVTNICTQLVANYLITNVMHCMVAKLVSTKSPNIPQMCAKVYKFVHVMVSELNFPTLIHCSDTAHIHTFG